MAKEITISTHTRRQADRGAERERNAQTVALDVQTIEQRRTEPVRAKQARTSQTMVVGTDGGAEFRLLDIEPIAYNADPRVADYKDADEVMRLFLGEY